MHMVKLRNSKKRSVFTLSSTYSIIFGKILEFIDNLILTVTLTKLNDDLQPLCNQRLRNLGCVGCNTTKLENFRNSSKIGSIHSQNQVLFVELRAVYCFYDSWMKEYEVFTIFAKTNIKVAFTSHPRTFVLKSFLQAQPCWAHQQTLDKKECLIHFL